MKFIDVLLDCNSRIENQPFLNCNVKLKCTGPLVRTLRSAPVKTVLSNNRTKKVYYRDFYHSKWSSDPFPVRHK